MEYNKQLELMKKDLNDVTSNLYTLVFIHSGLSKNDFIEKMTALIEKANEPSFYGGYDTVYCGYTYIDGNQVYFKFSAPKEEMQAAVGSAAPYLEMYRGGVYLSELGWEILMKYAMPYYYKEFTTYSSKYVENPMVKAWGNFMISED